MKENTLKYKYNYIDITLRIHQVVCFIGISKS
jgi:hypothetical protein